MKIYKICIEKKITTTTITTTTQTNKKKIHQTFANAARVLNRPVSGLYQVFCLPSL